MDRESWEVAMAMTTTCPFYGRDATEECGS
jgi:hypothetical protein